LQPSRNLPDMLNVLVLLGTFIFQGWRSTRFLPPLHRLKPAPQKVTGFSILIRVSYINTLIIESGKSTYATQFNRKKFVIFRYMTRRENYYRGAKFSSLTLAHQFHWFLIRAVRGAIWAP
jgi:hypothetical protein